MPRNKLDKMKDALLPKFGVNFAEIVERPEYSIPEEQTDLIKALATEMGELASRAHAAYLEWRSLTTDKGVVRKQLVHEIGRVQGALLLNPEITRAMIVGTGLLPPKRGRSPVKAYTPFDVFVQPHVNGIVDVSWKRGRNQQGVTFVIEVKLPDEEWKMFAITTRTRARLDGFAPGVTVGFRVRASKSARLSIPSEAFWIYPGGVGTFKPEVPKVA